MSNCHCSDCAPLGACCFKGLNEANSTFGSLGTANTGNVEDQYFIDTRAAIQNIMNFVDSGFAFPNELLEIKVKCNLDGQDQDNQGIHLVWNSPSGSINFPSNFKSWVSITNLTWMLSEGEIFPALTNQIVVKVKNTGNNNTFSYTFEEASDGPTNSNTLHLLKNKLVVGSDQFPEFSETFPGNLWGNNPEVAIYPKFLYHEFAGCEQNTEEECIDRENSNCWISQQGCEACPSSGGDSVDDCGCWTGADTASCNEGCKREILPNCNSTNTTVFTPFFFDKNENEQDGFVVGSVALYNNSSSPQRCGNVFSSEGSNCDTFSSSIEVGEMDLSMSENNVAGNFCPPTGFEVLHGSFKNIIRTCHEAGVTFGDACGDCCWTSTSGGDEGPPCTLVNNPFSEDYPIGSEGSITGSIPKIWHPTYATFQIPKTSIAFVREDFVNRLIAKVTDNGVPTDNSDIPVTNSNYIGVSETHVNNLEGIWKKESVKSSSNEDDGERDAFNHMQEDWQKMDTTWEMKTYCLEDVLNEFIGSAYESMFVNYANEGAWYANEMEGDPVFLRVWTTANRSIVRDLTQTIPGDETPCCQDTPVDIGSDGDVNVLYRLDMHWANDSQTERVGVANSCDTGQCDCVWSNPWRETQACLSDEGYGNNSAQSVYDNDGNKRAAPEAGDFRYPLVPHEYGLELWYIGEKDTICSDSDDSKSHPDNFRLMGFITEAVNCGSVRPSDTTLFDTCETFYHQGHLTDSSRTKTKIPFILTEGHNQEIQSIGSCLTFNDSDNPCNYSGIDDSTVTRKITFTLDDSDSGGGDDGEGGGGNSGDDSEIAQLNPPASPQSYPSPWNEFGTANQEENWYHSDPKHDFDAMFRGRPQAMGRFTELPFVNVAEKVLADGTPGFYLTISAFHLDGIEKVEFYLDGGSGTDGVAVSTSPQEHPTELAVAQIERDEEGNLRQGLMEYTVKIPTDSFTDNSTHEIRAKIWPKQNSEGLTGVPRFIYGEPVTGTAAVLLDGQSKDGRVAGEYRDYGPIKNQNWPVSKAQWPLAQPDGPVINSDGSINNNPLVGALNKWNLANNGFDYYASEADKDSDTLTSFPQDRYVFGATTQQKLIQNGYESYFFHYNSNPEKVYVGSSLPDGVPAGTALVSTIFEAFCYIQTLPESDRHDAEIILVEGTEESPAEYWWLNKFRNPNEPLASSFNAEDIGVSTLGMDWCQNLEEKKALVIRGENPDSKDKTRILFPPGSDRGNMGLNNFVLHVKDLTLETNLAGHNTQNGSTLSKQNCLTATGTNCRLITENLLLISTCSESVPADEILNTSGDCVCGDTINRSSSGVVTGTLDYAGCPPPHSGDSQVHCAKDTSICDSLDAEAYSVVTFTGELPTGVTITIESTDGTSKVYKSANSGSNGDLDGSDVIFLVDSNITTQANNLSSAIESTNGHGTGSTRKLDTGVPDEGVLFISQRTEGAAGETGTPTLGGTATSNVEVEVFVGGTNTCCGRRSETLDDGEILDCSDCTTAGCDNCERVCECRAVSTTWWPFVCKNNVNLQWPDDERVSQTNLLPTIDCGDNECSGPSWDCKGMFSNNIDTASDWMCLGTEPKNCIKLGKYNVDLMSIALGFDWQMGIYGKSLESRYTVGPTVKDFMLLKHNISGAASVDLFTNQTHTMIIDHLTQGSLSISNPTGLHNDLVQWPSNGGGHWQDLTDENGNDIKDFDFEGGRQLLNHNVITDNRMMVNIKLDNHFGRIFQWVAPQFNTRDSLQDPNFSTGGATPRAGHPNSYGMPQLMNIALVNFYFEDMSATNQALSPPINHFYVENWISASPKNNRRCFSQNEDGDICGYVGARKSDVNLGYPRPDDLPTVAGKTYGLRYGRKHWTNTYFKNICFEEQKTTQIWWNEDGTEVGLSRLGEEPTQFKFDTTHDYGPNATGAKGNNFEIDLPDPNNPDQPSGITVPNFYNGSHTPVFENMRYVRFSDGNFWLPMGGANKDGTDDHLARAGVKAKNITGGPVALISRSPILGTTSGGGTILNEYASDGETSFLVDIDAMTPQQLAVWQPDSDNRLRTVQPRLIKTRITSDWEMTNQPGVSTSTTSFDFPSIAHEDLLSKAENITDYGMVNVGGITLETGNGGDPNREYYHSLCSRTCNRTGPIDARGHAEPKETYIMDDSSGTREWVIDPTADCGATCLTSRDYYINDNETDSIDLYWCPIIDECICQNNEPT